METTVRDRSQPRQWFADLAAIVGLLVATNLFVALPVHAWVAATVQLGAAAVAIAGAVFRGYSLKDLGLARNQVSTGSVLGGVISAAVAGIVLMMAVLPFTQDFFEDDRFVDLSAGQAFVEIAIRIPFVTALTEEVLFRSVLLAVLLVALPQWRAVAASSLLFGLWHVLTTVEDLQSNALTDDLSGWQSAGSVVGVVIVTGIAGGGFGWLRLRSDSTVAPWLVHASLNASTFAAGLILNT